MEKETEQKKIRVMIVDDMVPLCRKYQTVLSQSEELEVVAMAHEDMS